MLLAYGASITPRSIAENNILNLPPTLLRAMGLPVQNHFAGEPIDLFAADWSAAHPVHHENNTEHFAAKQLLADIDI
jgi:hypothetical protein